MQGNAQSWLSQGRHGRKVDFKVWGNLWGESLTLVNYG
jgi:hypothetical protein